MCVFKMHGNCIAQVAQTSSVGVQTADCVVLLQTLRNTTKTTRHESQYEEDDSRFFTRNAPPRWNRSFCCAKLTTTLCGWFVQNCCTHSLRKMWCWLVCELFFVVSFKRLILESNSVSLFFKCINWCMKFKVFEKYQFPTFFPYSYNYLTFYYKKSLILCEFE